MENTAKMATRQRYEQIREGLQNVRVNNALKDYFQAEIGSPRRLANIDKVGDLIRLLEKRDVLGPDQMEHLHYITCATGTTILWNEAPRIPTTNNIMRVIPSTPADPIRRVHTLIVKKIGSSWRNLARELEVPEGIIEKLQEIYHFDFDKRIYEVLQYHRESSEPNQWRPKLQNALREARRLDLSNKVGELLSNAGIS